MTVDRDIKELDEQFLKAARALNDSETLIQSLFVKSANLDFSLDSLEDHVRTLQLILQYRLDTQDALVRLMRVEGALLQILGVEVKSGSGVNLERLAFAIGVEDLHQILFALTRLIEALLQAAHHYQKRMKTQKEQKAAKAHHEKFRKDLTRATKQQKAFAEAISEVGLHLERIQKREAIGPVLNHIAALRGPISRFYQALQNGLMQAHGLYQRANQSMTLDKNLGLILKQVDDLVKQLSHPNDLHFFKSLEEDSTQKKLEQRAAKRRFGHFFGH